MSKRLKSAVIGCGRIGAEFDNDPKRTYVSTHTGAYATIKDTDLVAVCDTDKKKVKECSDRWDIKKVFTDFGKMMEECQPEVVSICTPPSTHYPVLKELVKYGPKAIFCEKPIAASIKDAEKMIKLCDENNILFQIDHQRRFDKLHAEIKKLIEKKKFGDVQHVNFYYTAGVRNTGSHMFDLMRLFFGDAEWIEAFYSKHTDKKKEDPDLDGVIRFKSGLFATFQACDVKNYLIFEMNIIFDKARIILKNSGLNVECHVVKDSKYFSGYKELGKSQKLFSATYKRNFMINAVNEIVTCLRKKKRSVSSGKDGLAALKMIEAAVSSAGKDGKRIEFK
ncbi:MAG: Gfo/Idh/MocA family oxidoreductase [Candidatus Orphnella occulta]|nr:Gfo/Idh/MocA family oxidoreductase [Candidatus Orphnella occulta]